MKRLCWLITCFCCVFARPVWADSTELTVAVAANFVPVFEQIAEDFQQHSGIKVKIASGASGALYTQILHGAPFDLFLSADIERPQLLEQRGLIVEGSRTTYAIGILAFWSRHLPATEQNLRQWSDRFSIANARTAPYGLAAEDVLEKLNLNQPLNGKLLRGNSVVQAFQYVDSGNVDGGLVALSLLLSRAVQPQHYWVVPNSWHSSLEQQAVVLKRSRNLEQAQALMQFLLAQTDTLQAAGYNTMASAMALK